ncbi:hypothetical protein [Clostridioides difficile]|uniref:hypothetical protein n=1 Tax=Clostridioides difficile TaxID=1496 RepID=UPI0010348260|nr:hypothetical protein [Clostridioides difficile]MDM9944101.1 hypothetical protein [Clostridioides difficile]
MIENTSENPENKLIDFISQFVETIDTDEDIKEILKKILFLDEDSQTIIKHFILESPMDNDDIKTCINVIQDFVKKDDDTKEKIKK